MTASVLHGGKKALLKYGSDRKFSIGNLKNIRGISFDYETVILFSICRSIRSFAATLGPAGGKRGYAGITGHVSNGLAWYINGLLVPELWLRRGLTYAFKVSKSNRE